MTSPNDTDTGGGRIVVDIAQLRYQLDEVIASGQVDGPDAVHNWAALQALQVARVALPALEAALDLTTAPAPAPGSFAASVADAADAMAALEQLAAALDLDPAEVRRRTIVESSVRPTLGVWGATLMVLADMAWPAGTKVAWRAGS